MVWAMKDAGTIYADCYFVEEFKGDEESHGYVEIQVLRTSCSATRVNEPQ